jgi:starvation-inducible DNA-binding protein
MKSRKDSSYARTAIDPSLDRSQPILHQHARETQSFETITAEVPIGLSLETRQEMIQQLNQILADTMTLRDLYKKCHWQVSGKAVRPRGQHR